MFLKGVERGVPEKSIWAVLLFYGENRVKTQEEIVLLSPRCRGRRISKKLVLNFPSSLSRSRGGRERNRNFQEGME